VVRKFAQVQPRRAICAPTGTGAVRSQLEIKPVVGGPEATGHASATGMCATSASAGCPEGHASWVSPPARASIPVTEVVCRGP
jgi:hypothetical protein